MKTGKTTNARSGFDFDSALQSVRKDVAYWQEDLLIKVADRLGAAMDDAGVTRSDLARKLGVSAPYVTKILRGHENMTLETLAAVAFTLEKQWDCLLVNLDESICAYGAESTTGAKRIQRVVDRPVVSGIPAACDEDPSEYKLPVKENSRDCAISA